MPDCDLLVIHIGQLVTNADAASYNPADDTGPLGPKTGEGLRQLGLLADAAIAVRDGEVVAVDSTEVLRARMTANDVVDAGGLLVTPGLIDPHTHPVFARDRAGEFEQRLAGVSYEEIAARGGGILNSVTALREMSEDDLLARTVPVFDRFLQHGTTTIEAKSGYGLDTANELKMLRVLERLRSEHPLETASTFLGAHELPAEYRARENGRDAYIDLVVNEMIPVAAPLAEYVDVFCERNVFDAGHAERVLAAGQAAGLGARLHTDEFADIGGLAVAAQLHAKTADHLHVTTATGVQQMAEGGVMPVLLPGVPFFLGGCDTAPARTMIDAGLPVVLATDYNPGSAHIISQPFVMSLACLQLGFTPAEALTAATVNAAFSIDRGERLGRLLPEFDADFVIWDLPDYRGLAYHVGHNAARRVYKRGTLVAANDAPMPWRGT